MSYSLDRGLLVDDCATGQAAVAAANHPAIRFLPWRKLDPEHRLRAIEEALTIPANDMADGLPLAL